MKNKGYAVFFLGRGGGGGGERKVGGGGGGGGGANKVHKWRIDRTNESVNNSQSSSATFIIQRWSTPNKERFGGLVLIDC